MRRVRGVLSLPASPASHLNRLNERFVRDLWKNWEIRVRSREFGEERMREASKEKRFILRVYDQLG